VSDICSNNHGNNPFSIEAYYSTSSEKREARRRAIFKWAAQKGDEGITADEVTTAFKTFHNCIAPRISELKRDGLLIETNIFRETRLGRNARVYIVNPDKVSLLNVWKNL
jgi:hypothetical protein